MSVKGCSYFDSQKKRTQMREWQKANKSFNKLVPISQNKRQAYTALICAPKKVTK